MSTELILTQTEIKQRRSSDPKASAFVAANAGSGKTYVLVRRILRLLVDGVDPSRILALTYTTAAAANMANRVFKELSAWVRLDDDALKAELRKLDGTEPNIARLRLARQLFARAIETPGGLKIQTIHAFCERVLHLFPFEANVPAGFEVLDEQSARDLLESARNSILNGHLHSVDPDLAKAVMAVADEAGESQFDHILRLILNHAARIRDHISNAQAIEIFRRQLAIMLGLNEAETSDRLIKDLYEKRINDRDAEIYARILLASDKKTDRDLGEALQSSLSGSSPDDWQEHYISVFLTSSGTPRAESRFVTKDIRRNHPDLIAAFLVEQDRVVQLRDKQKSANAIERTCNLVRVARAMLASYEDEKALRGVLDFHDLVEYTRRLLQRTSAQWVLYKLDKGIDHLLIDEAQDTSPEQWDILERLTEEFYAGKGARSVNRSVFAVGDPKQSIYSFQGADPEKFAEYRDRFSRRVKAMRDEQSYHLHEFYNEILTLSFRSTPDVLSAVDAVFSVPPNFYGLDRDAEPTQHQSIRINAPGLVEIWDVVRKEKVEHPEEWVVPLDRPKDDAPSVELARRIASHIKMLVDPASTHRIETLPGQFRSIVPGDILILVRKRSVFFETMIRALKDLGLPVAGADRLRLASHIAVMDLVALGESLLTPEDDLTLATVLKSPLFGLSEDMLLELAYGRSGSLLDALMAHINSPDIAKARDFYLVCQRAAQKNGPFGFYSFVLGSGRGRAAFRARLGAEAEDAIDEFLRLALEHDHHESPSLARFLTGFRTTDRDVRRDMESGRNEIRVMTVHGAKGLEAPIVYLPDTCGSAVGKGLDPIFDLGRDPFALLWVKGKDEDSLAIGGLRDEMQERARREHRRLLYVALTRARDRLYIAGYTGQKAEPDDSWYAMIEAGLAHALDYENDEFGRPVRRLQSKPYPSTGGDIQTPANPSKNVVPEWLFGLAPEENITIPPIKPSSAIDAAERIDRPVDQDYARLARRRGTLVHALLELLPDVVGDRRETIASAWLQARAPDLSQEARDQIMRDVIQLISSDDLGILFGQASRAEVPIAGLLHRSGKPSRKISGQVDRLAVLANEIVIADYKTATQTPRSIADIPEAYIAQLAAYRALIPALYPDRPVRCLLIYTSGPTVFEIDAARLDMSLAQIA